jgi:hypothetical protein
MSEASRREGTATSVQKTTESPVSVPAHSPASQAHDVPRREDVANLAYQLWKERGRPEGSPDEDWFRAEKQRLRSTAG